MRVAQKSLSDYRIRRNDFIIESGITSFRILRDEKTIVDDKKMLEDYFNTLHQVFLNKIERLKESSHKATVEEQKDLIHMLETFIDTQRMLRETEEGD